MMHARQRASQPLPDEAELAEWMYNLAVLAGDEYFDSEYDTDRMPNKYRLTYERLEKKSAQAAEASLLGFDPGYLALQAARGHESKRPPVFALDILDSVQGLSIAQQAAKLGVSASTVSRRRRQALAAAKLPPVVTGDPGWDALLADLD